MGYNKWALLAGAWLAGNGGVRTFLRGQGNPNDKKWSKSGAGVSVKDRMALIMGIQLEEDRIYGNLIQLNTNRNGLRIELRILMNRYGRKNY